MSDPATNLRTPAVYAHLGVRPVINAAGNYTEFGGSRMTKEVLEAMAQASLCYVDMHDLNRRAGARIAEAIGVEAAHITSGAAAGLVLAVAACMTGTDLTKIRRLPDTSGLRNEVLLQKSQSNRYDRMLRLAGARIVEFGLAWPTTPDDLRDAITERTCAVEYVIAPFLTGHSLPLDDVIAIAHDAHIPVIVDAAAEVPPAQNLGSFVERGADLVVFSGGKDLRGPQCTGLILGRADLIEACRLHSAPYQHIGRAMKVGREEIVGLVVAVERYLALDREAELACWEARVQRLLDGLSRFAQLRARRVFPDYTGRPVPRVAVGLDPSAGLSPRELASRLAAGGPSIRVHVDYENRGIHLDPTTLEDDEVDLVVAGFAAALD